MWRRRAAGYLRVCAYLAPVRLFSRRADAERGKAHDGAGEEAGAAGFDHVRVRRGLLLASKRERRERRELLGTASCSKRRETDIDYDDGGVGGTVGLIPRSTGY